jgi:hypothetical protein
MACGSRLERPRNVRAHQLPGDGIEVSWEPVPGVAGYRVQLADLDTREPAGEARLVHDTRARPSGSSWRAAGVWVDALRGERAARCG